jgi:hypothetical protein
VRAVCAHVCVCARERHRLWLLHACARARRRTRASLTRTARTR